MTKRKLGRSGLEVSPLCFGGNVFGWTANEASSFQLMDRFVDAGFNFIDTADVYSKWVAGHVGGESETIIGKWLKRGVARARVIIATKLGKPMAPGRQGLSRWYMVQAVEDSLRRLQTDYIDLYQSHDDDTQTPLEETCEAFTQLIRAGKVRAVGASNFTAGRLSEALAVSGRQGSPRYECLQPGYNLCDRTEFETELEPLCLEQGLAVIPYFSLAAGFLTGKYRSEADLAQRARAGMVKKYLNSRGLRILDALDQVAREHGSTPARVALAWLLARPSITAPIVSATSVEQLDDVLQAANLQLDAASMERLSDASKS